MQNKQNSNEKRTPARRGRKLMIWLSGILAVVFVLTLVGWNLRAHG